MVFYFKNLGIKVAFCLIMAGSRGLPVRCLPQVTASYIGGHHGREQGLAGEVFTSSE